MQALRSALVIAGTTVREAVRSHVLMVVLAFIVAIVALSVLVAAASFGERARLVIDVGLAAASATGSLVAVALTVSAFGRELERHTAYPLLARPLPRWSFVLGKYLGLLATMVVLVTLTLLATAATVWVYGERVPAALWPSIWLACLEMAVAVSIALLFSCYTTPVLAATFSIGLLIAGNFAQELRALAERLVDQGEAAAGWLLRASQVVLPDVQALSLRTQAANDLPVPPAFVGWATVYAAAYAGTALVLAMIVFERRRTI